MRPCNQLTNKNKDTRFIHLRRLDYAKSCDRRNRLGEPTMSWEVLKTEVNEASWPVWLRIKPNISSGQTGYQTGSASPLEFRTSTYPLTASGRTPSLMTAAWSILRIRKQPDFSTLIFILIPPCFLGA